MFETIESGSYGPEWHPHTHNGYSSGNHICEGGDSQ